VRRIDRRAEEWMIRTHISHCYDRYLAEDVSRRLILALAYGFSPPPIGILIIARIDDPAGTTVRGPRGIANSSGVRVLSPLDIPQCVADKIVLLRRQQSHRNRVWNQKELDELKELAEVVACVTAALGARKTSSNQIIVMEVPELNLWTRYASVPPRVSAATRIVSPSIAAELETAP
jgi:hypothetical protein